jgi:MOSC domain-containing protein YiiM
VQHGTKTVRSAIFKTPIEGRVSVRGVNLEGDDQADRTVHGGPENAVYAYASEDYSWWDGELDRDLPPGQFGENLTTRDIDVNEALIGERWRAGTALLQVTTPRFPCYKLAMKMEDPHFIKRFSAALRPGAYLTILEEGAVEQGIPSRWFHARRTGSRWRRWRASTSSSANGCASFSYLNCRLHGASGSSSRRLDERHYHDDRLGILPPEFGRRRSDLHDALQRLCLRTAHSDDLETFTAVDL